MCHISVPMAVALQGLGGGRSKRGTQQENSYTKHAVTNRLPVRVTFGRMKELPILLTMCLVECFLWRRQLLRIKTNRLGFEDHRVATECYSWCTYLHNWV